MTARAMPGVIAEKSARAGCVVVALRGELDVCTAADGLSALTALAAAGARVVVDLAELAFMGLVKHVLRPHIDSRAVRTAERYQGRVRCLAGSNTSPLPGYPSRPGRAAARRRQLGPGAQWRGGPAATGSSQGRAAAHGWRRPSASRPREQTAPPELPRQPVAPVHRHAAHTDRMPARPRGNTSSADTPKERSPIASARAGSSAEIYPARGMSAHLACRPRQPCQGFLGRSGSRPGSRDARADVMASVRRRSA